jgi:hypothetical protein
MESYIVQELAKGEEEGMESYIVQELAKEVEMLE